MCGWVDLALACIAASKATRVRRPGVSPAAAAAPAAIVPPVTTCSSSSSSSEK